MGTIWMPAHTCTHAAVRLGALIPCICYASHVPVHFAQGPFVHEYTSACCAFWDACICPTQKVYDAKTPCDRGWLMPSLFNNHGKLHVMGCLLTAATVTTDVDSLYTLPANGGGKHAGFR